MKKSADTTLAVSAGYQQFIQELKARVISARISAARAITHEAVLLYWDIGRGIVEKQKENGWGDSVVEIVAADLKRAFPGARGFSQRNVWRMQQLYLLHTQGEFLSQVVTEMEKEGKPAPTGEILSQVVTEMITAVPWGHHAERTPTRERPRRPANAPSSSGAPPASTSWWCHCSAKIVCPASCILHPPASCICILPPDA